ncbi:hypothetical protein [Myceligenerans pegani]|uniref:Uncharacterized protein n=1 Tax=Myceligenerans pegani TaxID=2776917 RepID=A0ABR9N283_9MICO|nr:hypothetical protein [Myceligenerans sp. TRM 65318]MBE1877465.1 hypothetical protein [Myceligenerans sp. TRM 65318]MBE3019736.1 hypothetical protein [Myceligenerans sp. TRM 65318]
MRPEFHDKDAPDDVLLRSLETAAELVRAAGRDRVAMVTTARGWLCVQPHDLSDGERIARLLGCDNPLDHRLLVPGYTLWSGRRDGLEVQVRSQLRDPARALGSGYLGSGDFR